MIAVQTNLNASDLPDNLVDMRSAIEAAVPHGRTNNGKRGDRGAWHDLPKVVAEGWGGVLNDEYEQIVEKNPKAKAFNNINHLGTLGTGNHFIEVCLDEGDRVWFMLHSGSRGCGNRIGMYFIEKAKKEMEQAIQLEKDHPILLPTKKVVTLNESKIIIP
ncbi:hypothetical protein LCGC14_3111490, partial [marine sediment metagenome]